MINSMIESTKGNAITRAAVFVFPFLFCAFTIAYVFFSFWGFMAANGLIVLLYIFISKGKYRIYAFAFFLPLAKFMMIQGAGLGSFFTWNIIIYVFFVFLDYLRQKEALNPEEKKLIILILVFALYMLIINLINLQTVSFDQYFSTLAYLCLLVALKFDKKGEKSTKTVVFSFVLGVMVSNIIPAFFVYVLTSSAIPFLTIYIPNYVSSFEMNNAAAFRFPGLLGDPNHNSCCILLASTLLLFFVPKSQKKILLISSILILQMFALLGASKTYFVGLAVVGLVFLIFRFRKSKSFFFILITFLGVALIAFIILLNTSLGIVFRRLIIIDDRAGFLNGITTERTTIFSSYLMAMLQDPLRFLFGHGVNSSNAPIYMDAHNTVIEVVWHFGLLGSIIFTALFSLFFKFDYKIFPKVYLLPIIVIFVYSISLHLAYKEYLYMGIFIYHLCLTEMKNQILNHSQAVEAAEKKNIPIRESHSRYKRHEIYI